jgi:nucleotide-binding universal stress UspA family protein
MTQEREPAASAGVAEPAPASTWPRGSLRKILYATDLSSCSRQAFAPAASFARRCDAELHVFHAVVLFGQGPHEPMFDAPAPDEAYAAAAAAAETRLAALARSSCAEGARLVIVQRKALEPAAAILEYAREAGVDLLVMGTHGRSGPGRLLLGSVAEEVMRRAPCPVLVMRQLEDGKNRSVRLVRHIVVPVDFSLPAQDALLAAGDVALRYGARLTLLHVVEEPEWAAAYPDWRAVPPTPHEKVTARVQHKLRGAAAALPPGVHCEIELRGGDPATEIVAFAERTGADLVVMASRGLTGIERLVFGSTAEAVIRAVDAPVMVVHPSAHAAEHPLPGKTMEAGAPPGLAPVRQ